MAVLVTAENGLGDETPLKHVREDAARLEETLFMVGGFDRANIHRLDGSTPDKVFELLEKLEKSMAGKRETLLIFYYSGHADATSMHLDGEKLRYTELRRRLEAFQASLKIGIIDACNSGAIIGKGSLARASFTVDDSLKMKGTVILTSSQWNQSSLQQSALAGSIFSHHVTSGLRGAADKNSDGKVSLEEVYQYASVNTLAETRYSQSLSEQAPQLKRLEVKGEGPVILTWLSMARARLTLPRGQDVCFITNADERRLIAEGHSEPDRELHMALKPDSYVLKCRRQDEGPLRKASFSMAAGEHTRAVTLKFMEVHQQDILRKGALKDLKPRCTFDIVAHSIYVERNQRTNVINLEGLLELRALFSADNVTAPFYPSASTVVTMKGGETLRMNHFVTRVTIDKSGRVPLDAELWEVEFGFQGEDDHGSQRGSLHLDCSRDSDIAELSIPISADTLLEKSGTVVVQYVATRH
ncbi:caspase domain-containing protein [Archangium gephyra]|nr:caspase domain-containing protein [Archangium gephyra]